jgi:hypothetical protein
LPTRCHLSGWPSRRTRTHCRAGDWAPASRRGRRLRSRRRGRAAWRGQRSCRMPVGVGVGAGEAQLVGRCPVGSRAGVVVGEQHRVLADHAVSAPSRRSMSPSAGRYRYPGRQRDSSFGSRGSLRAKRTLRIKRPCRAPVTRDQRTRTADHRRMNPRPWRLWWYEPHLDADSTTTRHIPEAPSYVTRRSGVTP